MARASGLAEGRVYWGERPQATTMPALLLTAVSDDRPQTFKGFDLAPARVQIDAFASTAKAAWTLIEQAIAALVPGGVSNGHRFSRADIVIGPRDLAERVGSTTVFRVSMDLIVHHAENEEAS